MLRTTTPSLSFATPHGAGQAPMACGSGLTKLAPSLGFTKPQMPRNNRLETALMLSEFRFSMLPFSSSIVSSSSGHKLLSGPVTQRLRGGLTSGSNPAPDKQKVSLGAMTQGLILTNFTNSTEMRHPSNDHTRPFLIPFDFCLWTIKY